MAVQDKVIQVYYLKLIKISFNKEIQHASKSLIYPVKYSYAVMPLALFHRVDRPFAAKHMLFCQP
jgi:hypothetical protein